MRDAIVAVLLVAGVGIELLACAGVILMRDPLDRLHYVGATTAGALCLAVAVVARYSFSLIGNKALALAVFMLVTAPVVSHMTARLTHRMRSR